MDDVVRGRVPEEMPSDREPETNGRAERAAVVSVDAARIGQADNTDACHTCVVQIEDHLNGRTGSFKLN